MVMAKSNSKRKTRSDKFPLTLHPTGQYRKKIKGKLYYFGTDKAKALQQYLEQVRFGILLKKRLSPDCVGIAEQIMQCYMGYTGLIP